LLGKDNNLITKILTLKVKIKTLSIQPILNLTMSPLKYALDLILNLKMKLIKMTFLVRIMKKCYWIGMIMKF